MERSKKYFWVFLDILLLAGIINVLFFVMPLLSGWKNSFAPARTITVSAQGMTVATPDEADLSFSVVSQGSDPQTLSNDNNSKMSAVLQFVSSQGIASSDIATTGYDLEPNYGNTVTPTNLPYIPGEVITRPSSIVGYTLTQTVQVKVRDLTKVAAVLGGLAPLGVNQVGGVSFTFQDPNKFIGIARGQALTNAATQAAQMAAQAGASLGEVVSVSESSNLPYYPQAYAMSAGSGGAAAPVAPTIAPGTQNVTDNVNVTYALN
jgi:hypothetical protein